jgi:hypothetical protein
MILAGITSILARKRRERRRQLVLYPIFYQKL